MTYGIIAIIAVVAVVFLFFVFRVVRQSINVHSSIKNVKRLIDWNQRVTHNIESGAFIRNQFRHQNRDSSFQQDLYDDEAQQQTMNMADPYLHPGIDIVVDESYHGIDHGTGAMNTAGEPPVDFGTDTSFSDPNGF